MVGSQLASLMFYTVKVGVFGGVAFRGIHEEHVFDSGFGVDRAITLWLFDGGGFLGLKMT